jgi:hypothetical protein
MIWLERRSANAASTRKLRVSDASIGLSFRGRGEADDGVIQSGEDQK